MQAFDAADFRRRVVYYCAPDFKGGRVVEFVEWLGVGGRGGGGDGGVGLCVYEGVADGDGG